MLKGQKTAKNTEMRHKLKMEQKEEESVVVATWNPSKESVFRRRELPTI
jgi:hypothetical protein